MRALRWLGLLIVLSLGLLRLALKQPAVQPASDPGSSLLVTPARQPSPIHQLGYPGNLSNYPGAPPLPPPPDPATTQPFVPPITNFSGTPAALSAPDLQAQIEKRYEDMDYAFLTRKPDQMAAFYDDKVRDSGKLVSRATEEAMWKENFQSLNDIEAEHQTSLRVGASTEILKLTPKGSDRVAVQYKTTQRGFATINGNSLQLVWIVKGRDLWVRRGDTWKIAETDSGEPEKHTYINNEEVFD